LVQQAVIKGLQSDSDFFHRSFLCSPMYSQGRRTARAAAGGPSTR
jgi:hypothetical protein